MMIGFKTAAVVALSSLVLATPAIQNRDGNIVNHGSSNGGGPGPSNVDWRSKIKNVVVLVEENRSFDTFAGGLTYSGAIDGLLHHNYCNSLLEISLLFMRNILTRTLGTRLIRPNMLSTYTLSYTSGFLQGA